MIVPISILVPGTFRSFGGPLRFIAQERKVKIAKTDFTRIYISCDDLTTRVSGKTPAIGSLVIAKFDEGYLGVRFTYEVGRLADDAIHHLLDLLRIDRCGRVRGRHSYLAPSIG
jgi:hypothetical protein